MPKNYTRAYNPQPTQRVGSAELVAEFQAIDNAFSATASENDRALRQSGGSAVEPMPNAISRALKVLSFDASGNPRATIAETDLAAAVTAAATAETQAGISTAQAGISTAKAVEAAASAVAALASETAAESAEANVSASASAASASASTATTQAGIATTRAGEAASSASTASTAAATATTKASEANASASAAASSASSASTSATTATTKAGEASTSATAAAASAAEAAATLANKLNAANPSYTGILTGGTGVVNLGSGQFVKDIYGNVGLNTTPSYLFDARSASSIVARLQSTTSGAYLSLLDSGGLNGYVRVGAINNGLVLMSGNNINATLDSAGNFALGGTPSAWSNTYRAIQVGGLGALAGRTGTVDTLQLSQNSYRNASGDYVYLSTNPASRYDQSAGSHTWYTAPSGTAGNPITFTQAMTLDTSGNLAPGTDNTQVFGYAAFRWSTIYAGTGTINTSDAREKTAVRAMATDEIEAAKALSKEIGVYQFLDSVAVKGDKARHHIGMTVQRAIQIMEAHGLNPFAYGFICFDKWDEETKEHPAIEARDAVEAKEAVLDADGNVVEPAVEAQPAIEASAAWTEVTLKAGDRYSFRYDQLTLFIARGIHARLEALEAK